MACPRAASVAPMFLFVGVLRLREFDPVERVYL